MDSDLEREFDKIDLALISAQRYFERNSEANAALHGSEKVVYSPIVTLLNEARTSLDNIMLRIEE